MPMETHGNTIAIHENSRAIHSEMNNSQHLLHVLEVFDVLDVFFLCVGLEAQERLLKLYSSLRGAGDQTESLPQPWTQRLPTSKEKQKTCLAGCDAILNAI